MRDPDKVLSKLANSSFRSRFRLNAQELKYLREKGLEVVLMHGARFIEERLAPAYPARDGKQTPYHNHPVFVAQHATGTCCRGCLEKWHGIKRGRRLLDVEKTYILSVLEKWLLEQYEEQDASRASVRAADGGLPEFSPVMSRALLLEE